MNNMVLKKLLILAFISILSACAAVSPAPENLACSDRECLKTLVDNYLQALVQGNPEQLPFAEDAVFVENVERKAIGTGLWETATALPNNYRIYVPDPVSAQVGFIGLMEAEGDPILLGLRLQVEQGQIIAAEHLISWITNDAMLANLQNPRAGLLTSIPESQQLTREELLSIGYSYYPALDENNGILSPLADDCVRFENGMQTSNNSGAASIFGKMLCGPQLSSNYFQYIDTINNRRVTIADPETGLVFGLSHFRHSFDEKETPIYGVQGQSVRDVSMFNPFDMPAMHIFKIGPEGQIHEIEAVGVLVPYQSPTGWGW